MMFSKRDLERLAGALLLISFLLMLGHGLTGAAFGAGRATIVCVLLYGFPIALSGIALHAVLRPYEPTLAAFSAFGLAAHGLFVVLTAGVLLAGLRFPAEFVTFGGEPVSVGAASSLELSMDKFRTAAFVFLGLGLLPLGTLMLWSGATARWIGWLASVAGVLGFFGLTPVLSGYFVGRPAGITTGLAVLGALAFMLVLGIRLLATGLAGSGGPERTAPA